MTREDKLKPLWSQIRELRDCVNSAKARGDTAEASRFRLQIRALENQCYNIAKEYWPKR